MKAVNDFIKKEYEHLVHSDINRQERVLTTPQGASIETLAGKEVLNLCANNYLGLSNHPEMIKTAKAALDRWGYGLSSVRFICGTQAIHRQLEDKISDFLGMEDAILYSSCYDANGGLFETLLGPEDAIISDALNHASIIDGVRLCKAKRFRYANSNMQALEERLMEAKDARIRLIVTDGVFSMDGYIANLQGICDLADKYDAMVMVDDSHAVGFLGESGRGSHEFCQVMDRVDIITGTFGKALGGASGGFTCASKELVKILRLKSRPYLFSNSLAPAIVASSLKALELIQADPSYRERLYDNTRYFRHAIEELGLDVLAGSHPIVPIMLYEEALASRFAQAMLEEGVYVIAFSYPVVPKGKARIRTQISSELTKKDLDFAVSAFSKVARNLGILS